MKRQNLRMPLRHPLATAALASLLMTGAAHAQEAPVPHRSPRVPVNSQQLPGNAILQSREVEGPATILDGEHLRINAVDLRLFGIVPPQLSASFGPQARAALDEVTRNHNVECRVRDRDHDGHFLATCYTPDNKADLALELVRRGLAVTARGTLQPTDLAASYEAAEEAAQAQRIGLWSVTVPPTATPVAAAAPAALPAAETRKEEKTEEKQAASINQTSDSSVDKKVNKTETVSALPPLPTSASPTLAAQTVPAAVPVRISAGDETRNASGFFARYQLLFAGVVMLMTAFGIMAVLTVQRRRDQRDEMKAIAAALRGELLAARAVYQNRLKNWNEADDRGGSWPRTRSTLYQAYVGRLGWLGAILARQIASIYGQANDYAAYFNFGASDRESKTGMTSRRHAIQTLVQHIEEVLPRLASIEQSGLRPKGEIVAQPKDFIVASAVESYAPAQAGLPPPEYAQDSQPSLWNSLRKFTNRPEPQAAQPMALPEPEEPALDYATLIEEEMARMSYDDGRRPNVTKFRTGS